MLTSSKFNHYINFIMIKVNLFIFQEYLSLLFHYQNYQIRINFIQLQSLLSFLLNYKFLKFHFFDPQLLQKFLNILYSVSCHNLFYLYCFHYYFLIKNFFTIIYSYFQINFLLLLIKFYRSQEKFEAFKVLKLM